MREQSTPRTKQSLPKIRSNRAMAAQEVKFLLRMRRRITGQKYTHTFINKLGCPPVHGGCLLTFVATGILNLSFLDSFATVVL